MRVVVVVMVMVTIERGGVLVPRVALATSHD
jgi:hypothetical protein